MFRQIPWIDEVVFANNTHEQVRNDEFTYEELFKKVIGEFEAAYKRFPRK